MTTDVLFKPPVAANAAGVHHAAAAAGNAVVTSEAVSVLADVLAGTAPVKRILLKAAAGAGKSYAVRGLVADAISRPTCRRVAIVAFTNKQIHALAGPLGDELGKEQVCLFVAEARLDDVATGLFDKVTVTTKTAGIPDDCKVLISTCHKLGAIGERKRQEQRLGAGFNGESVYDVLFVDEAWQIPHHLFDRVAAVAPIVVGVGDVGQLPPLEAGTNPWRGDPGHNPYRAWPTDFDEDESDETWSRELPAVWRPPAGHLGLWRAFYPEWGPLECVAAADDRSLRAEMLGGAAAEIWAQVGTGVPTLLEVDGLPEAEAADIDLPLMGFVAALLDDLFAAGFSLTGAQYDADGNPTGKRVEDTPGGGDDPLVAILATRSQAVDDAADVVERLSIKHGLKRRDLVSSTVDSYQGQTNGLTVAIHPLSGASQLDTFNSAFGRLAVTCTRATHGLLVVSRPGLDRLLAEAPARPGTPFGEPGNRQLPRQTHQRILATFARATINVGADV